jgi:hypothetical protein
MEQNKLDNFANEIQKTGFVLENRIAQELKNVGWTVISNKYYIDDLQEAVREIDLVAYRVTKMQHFNVYTTLIISCKKSEENAWALLSREINWQNPNIDWYPFHAWSNDKALIFQLSEPKKASHYYEQLASMGVAGSLGSPTVEVFAFQEMNKKSGKPQNDKSIFSAVTSLMKAQAYELAALPTRQKAPSVYQFNLLSIADTDLIRLMFRDSTIECTELEAEHYLARYIIHKREMFSRIRFIKADIFSSTLEDYGLLHEANCKWFDTECDLFYTSALKDTKRQAVLAAQFKSAIDLEISWILAQQFDERIDIEILFMNWDKVNNSVCINLVFTSVEVIDFLNSYPHINDNVSDILKTIYRYEGDFYFSQFDDIPF